LQIKDWSSRVALEQQARALKGVAAEASKENADPASLKERLLALTKSSPIVLFMKGTPAAPECGFSRQTVALMQKYVRHFGTVDILRDQAVRQGMKEFSNWPTFPQLYVEGEFVGGLDILKEMDECGELEEVLKPSVEALDAKLERLTKQAGK